MTDRLSALPATLDALQCGQLPISELARSWREAARGHQPELPQRYLDVLERLLSQLESAALFTEESCSFSQGDMADALRDWLMRARAL